MRPELFQIPFPWAAKGYIPIFSYGFMIMLGFIFSILYGAWRAKKEGEDPNHVLDIGIYAVVSGILGARLFYYFEFYAKHFSDRPWYVMFYIWEGGIVFYGGLIAGAATVLTYLKVKKLPVWKFADILACTIPVGLSFGRVGCTLNGCCWGRVAGEHALLPVQFPQSSPAWWYHVDHGMLSKTAAMSLPVHFTQVYEWAGAWLIAAALFFYYRLHKMEGQVFSMLLILYGPVRFVIESYRDHDTRERMAGGFTLPTDPLMGVPMTNSQAVSIGLFLFGVLLFALFTLRGKRYEPPT